MFRFSDICIGDMFNTKAARWVKVSPTEAIVVMSGVLELGDILKIEDDTEVVLLYSSVLKVDRDA